MGTWICGAVRIRIRCETGRLRFLDGRNNLEEGLRVGLRNTGMLAVSRSDCQSQDQRVQTHKVIMIMEEEE